MLVLALLAAVVACNSVLEPGEEVASLELTPGDVSLQVGSTVLITATGLSADGSPLDGEISWSSDDPTVATVSSVGLVTAIGVGEAYVEAEFKGKGNAFGRKNNRTRVKVSDPLDPQIPPADSIPDDPPVPPADTVPDDPPPPPADTVPDDPPPPPADTVPGDPPPPGTRLIGASRFDVTSDYPFTFSPQHRVYAGEERKYLDPLQQYGRYAVVNLAGGRANYQNPDKTFNVDMWKAILDEFDVSIIQEYIDAGWIVAHYVLDEPHAGSQWSGEDVDPALVDEAACHSKAKWPNLPVLIRTHPGWAVREEGAAHDFQCVDIWVGQYSARKGPIEDYVAENLADAQLLGAKVVGGLNPISGGDGSSGVESPWDPDKWMMSAEEIRTYGAAWLAAPIDNLGFWKWNDMEWYWQQPEIQAAVEYLLGL